MQTDYLEYMMFLEEDFWMSEKSYKEKVNENHFSIFFIY